MQFIIAGSIAAGVLLLVGVVRWVARRKLAKAHLTATEVDDFVLDVANRTKIVLLLLPAIFLGARALKLPPDIARLLRAGAGVSFIAQTALWASGFVDFWLRRHRRSRYDSDPAAAMTVNAFRVAAIAGVWIVAAVVAIENLGFNVSTLIAGLGIGAVAVALAMQNVLGDLFASLSIVVDKPFVIGDSIGVDQYSGVVEHIGLKTTRIRSADGEELIISNGDLLKSRIRNYKRMSERRALGRLVVDADTNVEKVERVPQLVRAAVEKHAGARFDRAHLVKLSEVGYEFEHVYFVPGLDYRAFLDIQQAVLIDVLRAFEKEEIALARTRAR